MPIAVYRVCRRIHARLDGEGARQAGGRWNSPGRAVVYMAESAALAVLENLVHMSRKDFPTGYVVVTASIPDRVQVLDELTVRTNLDLRELGQRATGDYWVDNRMSAVLRVPSAVVPGEFNYLMNPLHLEFAQIRIETPAAFRFDERLFG